jgi:hypothetical protein
MVLLEGQEAYKNIIRVLSEATTICFIITPWMTPQIAKDILKYCSALDIRVMLFGTEQNTTDSVRILQQNQNIKIFRNPTLHGKAILTDFELVSGSGNSTFSAFHKNDEFIEFRKDEDVRKEYYKKIIQWHNKSVPYEIKEKSKKSNDLRSKTLSRIWRNF